MIQKRVLILLSTYDGEEYVAEQIDSLLCQSYKSIDIVIRDDGSKDGTLTILSNYEQKHHCITVIRGDNVGCARSFWNLLVYAKTQSGIYDYFAFCDQDDYWLDDKISIAVEHIEKYDHDGACLYCSNLTYTDANLNKMGQKYTALPNTGDKAKSLVESFGTGCTMVFNKALLELATSHHVQRLHLHDLWMFHTSMFLGKIIYDPLPHILYRQHGKNEIGAKSTFSQRLYSKMKSLRTLSNQHFREIEAQELLNAYKCYLSPADIQLISFVAGYRTRILYRLCWFLNIRPAPKGLSMTRTVDNFFLKIRILLGKV